MNLLESGFYCVPRVTADINRFISEPEELVRLAAMEKCTRARSESR
jgi:hypothetical protein